MIQKADSSPDILTIANAVANAHDADIVVYSGSISTLHAYDLFDKVDQRREDHGLRPNVILYLTTLGGSADAAYQIARCFQQSYSKGRFTVFVGTLCKSAGTLIAVGANELIMTDRAELGPLDVQVLKHDELGEYTSGLTPTQALSTLKVQAFESFEHFFTRIRGISGNRISTKTAAQIAARLSVGCFSPIYRQIDPMRLGEQQRAMTIANHYGIRLNFKTRNLQDKALSRLVSSYPSHDFVIDKLEASTLFVNVRGPLPDEISLTESLSGEFEKGVSQFQASIEFISGGKGDDSTSGGGSNGRKTTTNRAGDRSDSAPAGSDRGRSPRKRRTKS